MANGVSAVAYDRARLFPIALILLLAAVASLVQTEYLTAAVFGTFGLVFVVLYPEWGIGFLLMFLMIQYRNQYFWATALIPSGEGLLSPNNVLGILLLLIMTYQLYRDNDWSFLRHSEVRLVIALTGLFVISAMLHPIDYGKLVKLGLDPPNQDPVRAMVSRSLFVVFFAFFLRAPRQIRLLVILYVGLSLLTALSASISAYQGQGWEGGAGARVTETYRAGGAAVITRTAGNPNRLAMISTLLIVLIWEYAQTERGRRWMLIAGITIMGLIVTVFQTASRGGLIGLVATGGLLLVRRRAEARTAVYAVIIALLAAGLISQIVPEEALERLGNIPGLTSSTTPTGGSSGTGSVERREYTLGIALELAERDPLLGIGPGNWEMERFLIDPARSTAVPHNSYMLAAVEGGIFTLTVYLLLFYVSIRHLGELERNPAAMERAHAEGLDWLIGGTRVCLISFLLFSLFSDLWETINYYWLVGVAAAVTQRYAGLLRRAQPA